ncbi:unnamed protein product, partial [Larinioides sclopetarius]
WIQEYNINESFTDASLKIQDMIICIYRPYGYSVI